MAKELSLLLQNIYHLRSLCLMVGLALVIEDVKRDISWVMHSHRKLKNDSVCSPAYMPSVAGNLGMKLSNCIVFNWHT